jgi:membrane protease YdiL (CAAX protease family)
MLLYVNAGAIFPKEYVPKVQSIMLLYMIMTFAFSIATNYLPPEVHKPFLPELLSFFVFFFVFAGILYGLPIQTASHIFQISETIKIALPFMVLFAFVVAYTEELIFRGILPKFLTVIGSNLLFGIFHWYAYSGDIYSILIATIFGFVFSFVAERFGLMSAVGMHTAWNLRILGAF